MVKNTQAFRDRVIQNIRESSQTFSDVLRLVEHPIHPAVEADIQRMAAEGFTADDAAHVVMLTSVEYYEEWVSETLDELRWIKSNLDEIRDPPKP